MNPTILKLIEAGESEKVEFKLNFNDEVIETIVAFANTSGGTVIIGLSNKAKIKGLTMGKETLQQWLNEIKNKTTPSLIPDIIELEIDGKKIIEIKVQEYPVKPVAFKGRYLKRIKNSNHQLSVHEIADIHLKSIQTSWDAYPYPDASIDDLSIEKVKQFIQKVNSSGRFFLEDNVPNALRKLRLIVNDVPTNAAMLLFSKNGLNHNVHVGRLKTPSLIIDDRIFSGGLYDVVEETMRYIIGQIKVAFEITGEKTQRNEIFEYPIPALRELVLNAIIHRDYTSPVDIQIKIFDQAISFFNPGKLFGEITIEDLKTDTYQSHTRNKLIAEAFYLTKDLEKYGSGYIRIRSEISQYPTMTFDYNEKGNGFLAILKYSEQKVSTQPSKKDHDNVTDNVTDAVTDAVTDRLSKIVELIEINDRVSVSELATKLNVSGRTVLRDIEKLKEKKILKREGDEKTGYWKMLK